ncbi:VAN3-binding protein [Panicum miliaceum]|uniref:VAN3-binding protein n=1 Tax=Panicum miliaceum TaxID=4540 RepID=A0A3L6TNP6_PANMI|nr:VAN3-binding protein [Panicum miliaceum]
MEHFNRGVELGMASFQRCHPLSCQMAESAPFDAQKAAIRCKEKSRRSKCCHPEELPVIPEQAMEYLSRTWSPSSSDLFQILSPSSLGSSPEDSERDEAGGDRGEDEEKHPDTVYSNGGTSQLFNPTWRVVASGKPSSRQRRHKLVQPAWLNVGNMKAMLRGFLLDSVPVTGSLRRRRRDELRLHSAQAHAAVSVAQLAAAVAGIVSVCDLRPAATASAGDKRLGTVLASAAALVATVCAEAAETAGANRGRVTSAVRTGLEGRSSAELLTLTATAATCLRGAAALKQRVADLRGISNSSSNAMAMSISAGIQKGTTLRVCLPCGRVRVRTVSVFPKRGGGGAVALRLGKKRLHGAFATYKDFTTLFLRRVVVARSCMRVGARPVCRLAASPAGGRRRGARPYRGGTAPQHLSRLADAVAAVGEGGVEAVVEGRPAFPVALVTEEEGATVQLLFEHQTHCKVWKAAIEGMLVEQKLKRGGNN